MIPTYHCASYLRETLESVLAQDPGPRDADRGRRRPLDADDPESVVHELGGGRVAFHRQPRNVATSRNSTRAFAARAGGSSTCCTATTASRRGST